MTREKKPGARWSGVQEQALREFWTTDAPVEMLAQALRRTVHACHQKAQRMGLPDKVPNKRRWVSHRR